jgi:two-component system, cell cycle sensor histidine kinase and response regulator CckA
MSLLSNTDRLGILQREDGRAEKQAGLLRTVLAELGSRLNAAQTARAAAEVIAELADRLLGWDSFSFSHYAANEDRMRHVLSLDTVGGRRVEGEPPDNDAAPSSLARLVMLEGGQLIVNEQPEQAVAGAAPLGNTTRPSEAMLLVPVRGGSQVIGVLSAKRQTTVAYTAEDLQLLQALADCCGGALERIGAQLAERETRASLQKAEEVAQLGSWWSGLSPDAPLFWSREVYRIFGVPEERFPSKVQDFFASVHPEDRPRVQAASQAALERGLPYDLDHRIILPDGTVRWVHEKAEVFSDSLGHPVRMVGVVQDVTERKTAELDLRRANEELELRKTSILDLLEDLKVEMEAQKRIEKALRNSEALYQSLLENIPQCILRKDRAGRFVFCNQNFCRLSGSSPEQLLGKTDAEVYPPELARKHREDDQRVMDTGQSLEFVEENITGQGRRLMHVIKSPVRDAGGQVVGVQAIFWDITEQKRAEEGMRHLAAIVESSDDAIIGKDLNGRILSWNKAAEQMYGYPAHEILGQPVSILVPRDRADELPGILAKLRRGENVRHFRTLRTRKDGQSLRVSLTISATRDNNGRVVGASTIARDITHVIAAESALRESEAQLAAIYDSAPVMMCVVNRQHQVGRMNRSMAQFVGGQLSSDAPPKPGELLGCVNALDDPKGCGFGPHCHTCPLRLAVVKTFETGQPCRQIEAGMLLTRGGIRREIQVSASTALVQLQDQPRVLVCLEDITGRKQLEVQFLHAQKMEALGQLAGGVAHDFNNILAAALLHLQLLQQRQNLEPELAASLRELVEGTQRAASLTRQLLLFSRRQVMQPARLDFNQVVQGLLKMLRRLLGEDVHTVFSPGPEPVWVEADAGMLEQVVMNLCVNARDAMPGGGRIELRVQRLTLEAEAVRRHPEPQPGRFACLTVTDTGCGMDEATLARIFEPFFTTKGPGKGTGLGLATVHGIAKQHHGWVEAESTVGRGTTFRVFLPAAEPPAAAQLQADRVQYRGGTETLLLVEDDEQVRRMVRMTLRLFGYEILEASNGAAALQMWERYGARVDLVFTDMVMPGGFTGLDLAERLRQFKPGLKVLFSSGYAADLLLRGGVLPAGMRFLAKPYAPNSLARSVRECLDEKGLT